MRNSEIPLNYFGDPLANHGLAANDICGHCVRFKQHQNLKRHMHTHTGIKPFTCDFCEKGYTDAYTLKVHISKIHPEVASSLPSMQITPRPHMLETVSTTVPMTNDSTQAGFT